MARKPRKQKTQGPLPQHGDVVTGPEDDVTLEEGQGRPKPDDEEAPDGDEPADGDDEDEEGDEPSGETVEQRLNRLERENARLQGEVRGLRSGRPQAPPQEEEDDEEPDWEDLFYKNPKEAARLMQERTTKKVTRELRSEYSRDQSQRTFWDAFYAKHDDLREDRDLVQATLNSHQSELMNMEAEAAGDRLAELTRQRILKYTGKQPPKDGKQRVRIEGARPPAPKPPKSEEKKVITLSDIIRNRRANREAARTGARKGSAA